MPKVKILKDCEASENGVDVIPFSKGQVIVVSDAMNDLLLSVGGVKRTRTSTKIETPESR